MERLIIAFLPLLTLLGSATVSDKEPLSVSLIDSGYYIKYETGDKEGKAEVYLSNSKIFSGTATPNNIISFSIPFETGLLAYEDFKDLIFDVGGEKDIYQLRGLMTESFEKITDKVSWVYCKKEDKVIGTYSFAIVPNDNLIVPLGMNFSMENLGNMLFPQPFTVKYKADLTIDGEVEKIDTNAVNGKIALIGPRVFCWNHSKNLKIMIHLTSYFVVNWDFYFNLELPVIDIIKGGDTYVFSYVFRTEDL